MANITVTKGLIGASDINFGTGTFVRRKSDGTYANMNQVYAASIPIADAGAHFTTDRVEYALGQSASRIKTISASISSIRTTLSASITNIHSATLSSLVKFWWRHPIGSIRTTSPTRITAPSGYYPVGGKIYYVSNTLGWSYQRNGGGSTNRGFASATGANALLNQWSKSGTWVYLYATIYSNSLALIGDYVTPSDKYNTNLNGSSYDTNTYLGCFKTKPTGAGTPMYPFVQVGNKNNSIVEISSATANGLFIDTLGQGRIACILQASTNNRQLPCYVKKPSTADQVDLVAWHYGPNSGTTTTRIDLYQSFPYGTDTDKILEFENNTGTAGRFEYCKYHSVASTPGILYHNHTSSATGSRYGITTIGWYDKYC